MNKIYIIGPVGSGKTTFSKELSASYNIPCYELDKVVWDDTNHVKRTDLEINKLFQEILNNDSWIIEDVGRSKFYQGRAEADIIYYLKMTKLKAYIRVIKRFLRQRSGKEEYNVFPDYKQLKYYFSIVSSYYKKENDKLKELEEYSDKLVFVNTKKLSKKR